MEKKVKFAVTEKACQALSESQASRTSAACAEPFRILSVSCGDGTFDAIVLQAMISKCSDMKIHYTGIDIDEDTNQKAMEELSALKTKFNDKVEIKIMTMDMHSLKEEIPPCDLILAIHVLYYATDLRKVLTDVHALLKTDGKCLFMI